MNRTDNITDSLAEEIQVYANQVMQLKIDESGKMGVLDVELQRNKMGRTIITRQFFQAPLHLQRVLYPHDTLPEMAYLYLLSTSGGVLQGDRYRTSVSLRNHALAHVTTQGALRIYGMKSNVATQTMDVNLDENCYLEYIPDQIIPFKNSRYYQEMNLKIHDNATLVYSEIITPGRVARGESFQYDVCHIKTKCKNQEGKIRFLENMKIEPKKQRVNNIGILGKHNILGTMYILTKKNTVIELEGEISDRIKNLHDVVAGASIMPGDTGIVIKILGDSTEKISDTVFSVVDKVRRKVVGIPFTKMRKC